MNTYLHNETRRTIMDNSRGLQPTCLLHTHAEKIYSTIINIKHRRI